ncbi:MAG: ATP-binding protein [Bacteroidetes bacterium]|nr:ATP-binding protein [Bacteroidota bacterium]
MKDFKQLARTNVLILDDEWGLHNIDQVQQRELMELLDDPYMVSSTIVTSQHPLITGMKPWKIPRSPMQS